VTDKVTRCCIVFFLHSLGHHFEKCAVSTRTAS
jgi:hypothetical protein